MSERDRSGNEDEAAFGGYGEELLCANWNPALDLLQWSCARTAVDAARTPDALDEASARDFLSRIYRFFSA